MIKQPNNAKAGRKARSHLALNVQLTGKTPPFRILRATTPHPKSQLAWLTSSHQLELVRTQGIFVSLRDVLEI